MIISFTFKSIHNDDQTNCALPIETYNAMSDNKKETFFSESPLVLLIVVSIGNARDVHLLQLDHFANDLLHNLCGTTTDA